MIIVQIMADRGGLVVSRGALATEINQLCMQHIIMC